MFSRAISAATAIQLNLEMDASGQEAGGGGFLSCALIRAGYYMMRSQFRSFFLLERTNDMFPTRLGTINADDVFLGMRPGASFEAQADDTSIPARSGCEPHSPPSSQPCSDRRYLG